METVPGMAATLPQTEAFEPTAMDYDAYASDDDVQESLSTPWPLLGFLGIPLLELVGQVISPEEATRALLVFPAVVLLLLVAGVDMMTRRRRDVSLDSGIRRYFFYAGWLIALGAFSAVYALVKHNDPDNIAKEIYHWFVEVLATAFLGVWAASRYSATRVCSAYIRACVLYGFVGLAVAVLGTFNMVPGGGVHVAGSRWFRLELGRGYPLIPLIIAGSMFFYPPGGLSRRTKMAIVVACFLLVLATVATLKRTQWLVVPVCLFGAMLSRRQLMAVAGLALCGFVLLWSANAVMPHQVDNFLANVKEQLTYNKNWSIDDTLKAREHQAQDGIKEGMRSPIGQGFGAEIDTISADGKRTVKQHYLHSLHAYYILQFGPLGYGLVAVVIAALTWAVFRHFDTVEDCQWMLRASLFSLVACGITGLALVSIHTTFAGMALGLAITSLARCKDEQHLEALAEWEEAYQRELAPPIHPDVPSKPVTE